MGKRILIIALVLSVALNVVLLGMWLLGTSQMEVPPSDQQMEDLQSPQPTLSHTVGYKDLITLDTPTIGDTIESPLVIRGEARGQWFFEATFPIMLTDWDGLIIAEGYAEAIEPWMTEEYVPFQATLNFVKPAYGERGTLILQKANASGLPEHDDAFEITVYFE